MAQHSFFLADNPAFNSWNKFNPRLPNTASRNSIFGTPFWRILFIYRGVYGGRYGTKTCHPCRTLLAYAACFALNLPGNLPGEREREAFYNHVPARLG